jgi:hypothetical protein
VDRQWYLNRSDGEPSDQVGAKIFRAIRREEADVWRRQLRIARPNISQAYTTRQMAGAKRSRLPSSLQ